MAPSRFTAPSHNGMTLSQDGAAQSDSLTRYQSKALLEMCGNALVGCSGSFCLRERMWARGPTSYTVAAANRVERSALQPVGESLDVALSPCYPDWPAAFTRTSENKSPVSARQTSRRLSMARHLRAVPRYGKRPHFCPVSLFPSSSPRFENFAVYRKW